jgi:hypothetical protein
MASTSIFELLNAYVQEMNKTPASKIASIEASITEIRMFTEFWEADIQNTQDPTQIIELRENIEGGRLEIVRLQQLIQDVRDGNGNVVCNIENIETNMV